MTRLSKYVVKLPPAGRYLAVNELADAIEVKAEHGGTIYERLGLSTAEQIEREDALAEALRLCLSRFPLMTAGESSSVDAALAAYDSHVAAMKASFPEEEQDQ